MSIWCCSFRKTTDHLVSSWLHWILLILERPAIQLHRDTYSDIPRYQSYKVSASTTIWVLMECLIHRHESHPKTVFIQGDLFQQRSESGPNHRTHWSYHMNTICSLTDHWSGLLKTQCKHQLRGNMLKGWGTIPQDAVYASNHKMRGYKWWLQLPSLPVTHWKTLLTIPKTLGSSGLEELVTKGGTLLLGYTAKVLLNYMPLLSPRYFGLPMSRDQQARRAVTLPAGVTDIAQREAGGW